MEEKYTMVHYLKDSERTAAHGETGKELFPQHSHLLNQMMETIVMSGHQADVTKRSIFYRETNEKIKERLAEATKRTQDYYKYLEGNQGVVIPDEDMKLIHSVLGIASEASEIMEAYMKAMTSGQPVDRINLKEEFGDILWYVAMGLRYSGVSFEDAAHTNIKKLMKRFPDKFSSDKALNRDLDDERKVLEGAA